MANVLQFGEEAALEEAAIDAAVAELLALVSAVSAVQARFRLADGAMDAHLLVLFVRRAMSAGAKRGEIVGAVLDAIERIGAVV